MPKRPYVPFYTSDWLGDTKVRRMSFEQRGVYFDLLCHAWGETDGVIPADLGEIANLLGMPKRRLQTIWPKIAICWEKDGNGGLVNPRLQREAAKQMAKQKAGQTPKQKGSKIVAPEVRSQKSEVIPPSGVAPKRGKYDHLEKP